MITVFGIRQCDTCRKALKWLEARGVAHQFHDLRADGLTREQLRHWQGSPFAAQLVNKRSTSWRGLTDQQRSASGTELEALLLATPTLIKRPLFAQGETLLAVGFKPQELADLLAVPA